MNGQTVILKLNGKGGLHAEAATAKPNDDHVLIGVKEGGAIPASMPRMRIGATYPLTLYPEFPPMTSVPATGEAKDSDAIPLYGLKGGGTPVWSQSIEKGTLIYVGVAPGYFASSERSAMLLRSLVEYAHQRAGGAYKESGAFTVKRGRFMIVKTFGEEAEIPRRSVDLLSADLNVAADRTVSPRSLGIYALLEDSKTPLIGFVAGQVIARIESEATTSFFVKGAAETIGIARIDASGKKLVGARAMTSTGENVPISAEVQGGTVLLKYPNNPDGLVIRVGLGRGLQPRLLRIPERVLFPRDFAGLDQLLDVSLASGEFRLAGLEFDEDDAILFELHAVDGTAEEAEVGGVVRVAVHQGEPLLGDAAVGGGNAFLPMPLLFQKLHHDFELALGEDGVAAGASGQKKQKQQNGFHRKPIGAHEAGRRFAAVS